MEIDKETYAKYEMARNAIKYWTEHLEELKAAIKEACGDDTDITLDGRAVMTYKAINQFAAKKFVKDDPELAAAYTRPVTKHEVDVMLIKTTNPALYEQYRVRRLEEVK